MATDATSRVVRRGRTSRPEQSARSTGGASRANRRLARKGSGRVPTRPDPDGGRDRDGEIVIELTKAQVREVIRGAGDGGTASVLFSAVRSEDVTYPEQLKDKTLSRSLLAGLLVLSCLPLDGDYMGVADVARILAMNTSTTHRYIKTLVAVGLLERDVDSRKYRIAGIG